jgi:hypothetical protein
VQQNSLLYSNQPTCPTMPPQVSELELLKNVPPGAIVQSQKPPHCFFNRVIAIYRPTAARSRSRPSTTMGRCACTPLMPGPSRSLRMVAMAFFHSGESLLTDHRSSGSPPPVGAEVENVQGGVEPSTIGSNTGFSRKSHWIGPVQNAPLTELV